MKIEKDTMYFTYFNANPSNRHTDDCVIRALATALDKTWDEVFRDLAAIGIKYHFPMNMKNVYTKYLKSLGYDIQKQPRKDDNTKLTGKEFCDYLTFHFGKFYNKKVIAHIGGHHIACIKYDKGWGKFKVFDTWDSTEGCVGNFWII